MIGCLTQLKPVTVTCLVVISCCVQICAGLVLCIVLHIVITFITAGVINITILHNHNIEETEQKSNSNDTIMNRRKKLCVFILAMITLVWILFMGQPRRVSERFQSDPPNSVIYIKPSNIGIGEEMSAYADMELYLRMTSTVPILTNFYENILVRSMRYFWPDISSMVVVLDHEKQEDHVFGNFIMNKFPFPRICYMDNLKVPGYSGNDRMQRDMFYPERCTSKKYVAFVDTDTVFITRIVPEMLFTDGKPIIIAVYGKEIGTLWLNYANTTTNIFKSNELMRCMAYFPVVLKVDHIIHARLYIEKLHGMPFDEVFIRMKAGNISQFNIMCQYIWLFHQNEYDFHFQLQVKEIKLPTSYRVDPLVMNKTISEKQKWPIARLCAHYKNVAGWKTQEAYRDLFRSSICFVGGFELCPEKCKAYDKTSLRKYMFWFTRIDWRWDNRCHEAQREHYTILASYASDYYSDIIRKGCPEVDTLTWSANKTLQYFYNQSVNH